MEKIWNIFHVYLFVYFGCLFKWSLRELYILGTYLNYFRNNYTVYDIH